MYSNEEDYEDEQDQSSSGSVLKDFYNNNKKLVIILIVILAFFIIASLISKVGSGGGSNTPANVKLTITYYENEANEEKVLVGRSLKLSTKFEGINNNPTVVWSSSDETIAKVEDGTVTGMKLGKVLITAIYNNDGSPVSDTCEVTVYEGMEDVELSNVSFPDVDLMMGIGNTYNLTLTYEPYNGYIVEKTFTSLNTNVATVDDDGKITAVRNGSTKISVSVTTLNGAVLKDEMNVYVLNELTYPKVFTNVKSMEFTSQIEKVSIDQEYQLTFNTDPNNANAEYLKWTSSDTSVATVDNGKVKGIKEGETIIKAYAVGNDSYEVGSVIVKVEKSIVYVDKITVSDQSLDMKVGDYHNVIVTMTPDNASNKNFTVTSNNTGVATVTPIGNTGVKIVANAVGTAFVTITSTDGKASQQIIVNVTSSQSGNGGGNSGGDSDSSGGGESCSSTYIRVNDNKGIREKSYEASRNNYKPGPDTINVEWDCGVAKVKYCIDKYATPCTPGTTKTQEFNLTIPDGDIYLLRIIKYDADGEVIGSSSDNYNEETGILEYFFNTKAKGVSVQQSGSGYSIGGTCGSSVAVNGNCQLILTKTGTNSAVSNVTWKSSYPAYLNIDSSGKVTGLVTKSSVTISAIINGTVVATKSMTVTSNGGGGAEQPQNGIITYSSKLEKYNDTVYALRIQNTSSAFNRLYLCYGICSGNVSSIINNAKWIDDYLFTLGMYAIDPSYSGYGPNNWYYYDQFGTVSTGKILYIKKPSSGNLKVFIANYSSSNNYTYSAINSPSW